MYALVMIQVTLLPEKDERVREKGKGRFMKIQNFLDEQGRTVFTMDGGRSVEDAIDLMTERDVTGIIIMEGDEYVGIFTERDVLLSYVKSGKKPFREVRLQEAMTNKLIVAKPEDEIAGVISLMTHTDIRHLPVVEDGKITALLYICDLVYYHIGDVTSDLRYLEEYVNDMEKAGKD